MIGIFCIFQLFSCIQHITICKYFKRGLSITLDAEKYGFSPGIDGSTIGIWLDSDPNKGGYCGNSACNGHFAFSFGGQQYFTFFTDLADGNSNEGILIYPECGGNMASGDPSTLISSISNFTTSNFRDAMAGGDYNNYYQLSATPNGDDDTATIGFYLTNNDTDGTFTFTFISSTFQDGLVCTYNKVDTCQDFTLYMSPGTGDEEISMFGVAITSYVTLYFL